MGFADSVVQSLDGRFGGCCLQRPIRSVSIVAAVPFLWVMPLTLYLMTFILCFDSEKWYTRKWFAIAAAVSIGGVCIMMMRGMANDIIAEVLIYFAGLFFCTMVCHGELVKLKPDPKYLTVRFIS